MKKGDICALSDTMFKILEAKNDFGAMEVLYIDKEDTTFLYERPRYAMNLGHSPEVYASFHAARSIHLRLNRIKP